MMHFTIRRTVFAAALACASTFSAAQSDALKDAAAKAVAGNPEVAQRFNAFLAAGDAVDVARAGWRPRVDLQASAGRDRDQIDSRRPDVQSLNRSGVALSVTQLLWDGLGTKAEVERLSHEQLARYFELLDTTEQTALEAARAVLDVLRFRKLVGLAEDNYVQLRYASRQIGSRVRAGVGRGVDLEQAGARVALAESNLVAETSNLHDVTARYQRVVGEAPAARLAAPARFAGALPASAGEAMNAALRDNAAISAGIAGLRAARANGDARRSALQPRVEARARVGGGHNFDGVADQKRDASAEVVLNWNLYNGGADQARIRQATRTLAQAEDLRDKVCRDVRQTAAIAFNDTRKLAEQIQHLDRNVLAIEKARDAYRQQFDIGQRSLLDLLNAENELYTAKRALANAESDLALAELRTLAATQRLTPALGIARNPALGDAGAGFTPGDDAPAGRCPAVVAEAAGAAPRATLDAQVEKMLQEAPQRR